VILNKATKTLGTTLELQISMFFGCITARALFEEVRVVLFKPKTNYNNLYS